MSRYPFGVLVLLAAGLAPAAEKELHVVAAHVGHDMPRDRSKPGTAKVTVDRPGKEVILVVHAYNPVNWEVATTPKTTLTKVIAVGYHRQSVIAPKGVATEELTHDGKQAGVSAAYMSGYYDIESPRFRPFVRNLFDRTGLDVLSFQGVYQFDPKKPFIVDTVQNDERLSSDFPKLPPAAQIPKVKFEATRIVFGKDRIRESRGFGEFTQSGPTADGFVQLPKGVSAVTYDTNAKQYYGLKDHSLHTVDLKLGTSAKIPPPVGFNWPTALTYDAKRERILITSRRGLFEYLTKNGGAWKQLSAEGLGSFAALAWHSKSDTLFAFGVPHDPKNSERLIPTLCELKADGTVAKKTSLGSPLFPGILGAHGMFGNAELIDLGAELVLLVHNESRDPSTGNRGKPEAFLYVIDPKTGKVQLAWKE
jgi:hypothetical protein